MYRIPWVSDRFLFLVRLFLFLFVPAVGAVGTVENSTLLVEFSKRCGSGGKTRFVFPRFPWRDQFP